MSDTSPTESLFGARCRCGQESIVRVALSDGCAAWPDDREQELCCQHARSIEPVGGIEVLIARRPELLEWVRSA